MDIDLSVERIQVASAGLLYLSEGDYPFEVIALDANPVSLEAQLRELAGKQKDASVEVVTLEWFFRNMVKLAANASLEQNGRAERFIRLQQVLQEELSEIAVYLIGEVEIAAFVIGRLSNGTFSGLRTKVIQT